MIIKQESKQKSKVRCNHRFASPWKALMCSERMSPPSILLGKSKCALTQAVSSRSSFSLPRSFSPLSSFKICWYERVHKFQFSRMRAPSTAMKNTIWARFKISRSLLALKTGYTTNTTNTTAWRKKIPIVTCTIHVTSSGSLMSNSN